MVNAYETSLACRVSNADKASPFLPSFLCNYRVDESEKIRVARYWIGEVGFELMESTTKRLSQSPENGALAQLVVGPIN